MRSEWVPSFRSFDGPFTYTSASGAEGRCYLNVYEHRGTLPVVLSMSLHPTMDQVSRTPQRRSRRRCGGSSSPTRKRASSSSKPTGTGIPDAVPVNCPNASPR